MQQAVFDANLPPSVSFIFAVLAFISIGGLRFAARKYFRNPNNLNKRPVIIYGAGEAGLQLLNALFHGNEFSPVAIVDDDLSLHNLDVGGLQVYSPEKIPALSPNDWCQSDTAGHTYDEPCPPSTDCEFAGRLGPGD